MNQILEASLPYYLTLMVFWASPIVALRVVGMENKTLDSIADKLQKSLIVFHFALIVVLCLMFIWIPA